MLRTFAGAIAAVMLTATAASASPTVGGPGRGAEILAEQHVTTRADNLIELAVQYDVGYVELVAANPGVDPWLPGEGREIRLPLYHLLPDAPNEGIVINIADMRLYYFPSKDAPVQTYPLGVGRDGFSIPLGRTKVTLKREHPTWVPPPSVRAEKPELPEVVPAGPDNPLGDYALNLGLPLYRIHGTNRPYGVGRRVSHGCIRLYPADIETLFKKVAVGTPVTIVEQPTKVGWVDGELYVEVHPSGQEVDELEENHRFTPGRLPEFEERILAAAGDQESRLDWETIILAWEKRTGLPTRITGARQPALADAQPVDRQSADRPLFDRPIDDRVEPGRRPGPPASEGRAERIELGSSRSSPPSGGSAPGRGLW